MLEPAEIRQIVREEVARALAQERSQLLAEIRELLKTVLPIGESDPVPAQEVAPSPEEEELEQIKQLLAQKEALEAQLEALTSEEDTDALLNAFADQETAPSPPNPDYSPDNPWFLGIDIASPVVHLCLANGITGRTYPLNPLPKDGKEVLAKLCRHWAEYAQHPQLIPADLPRIFQHIKGIILSASGTDIDLQALRLRQMVMQAGFLVKPEAVLVLDRAIAPLLAVLHNYPAMADQHFYLHLHSHTTSLGMTAQPVLTATIEQGTEHLELAIARHLFPILSAESTCVELAQQCHQYFQEHGDSLQWQYEQLSVSRSHYEQAQQKGLAPWLEHINRQLNQWMSHDTVIGQVWLIDIPAILQVPLTTWLQTKLPHAALQYLPPSAIAEGLAVAPFHRLALDIPRLQYSDYFLLNELCALRLPDVFEPKLLWQSLHQRGVNVRACSDRIQQIINHGLPQELELPLEPKTMLFQPTADGRLSVCRDIMVAVRSYLQQLQYELQQNLTEPLVFPHFRQLTAP